MNYAVVEQSGEWIVRHHDAEVARFDRQGEALDEVARRISAAADGGAASLALQFQPRSARA